MRKTILAAFIAVLGTGGAAAAAESCSLPSLADTVELKPLPGSDLMTVPVEVNGRPKQFLLDIGTNPTEISEAAAAELALQNAKAVTPLEYGGGDIMAATGSGISVPVVDARHNWPQRHAAAGRHRQLHDRRRHRPPHAVSHRRRQGDGKIQTL